ncbi:hypothetical protein ABFS82_05G026300 [Erythranthe guttata]
MYSTQLRKMSYNRYCLIPLGYHYDQKAHKISVILPPVEEFVFLVSLVTVCASVGQHFGKTDENSTVFERRNPYFHSFLIALDFAFTGAITTMSLRRKSPTIAWYCRRVAVTSVVAAAGILTSSLFRRGFIV